MDLCLDIGNNQIHGGVFQNNELLLQFRHNTHQVGSSDQLGIFLLSLLRVHHVDPSMIDRAGVASVVPSIDYSVKSALLKYFKLNPLFVGIDHKIGIKLPSHQAATIGADLIAAAVAAIQLFPQTNMLIFDLGTATTAIMVTKTKEFCGGAILPGIKLMMESLQNNTAKLFNVDILAPESTLSIDTKIAIQSGIYHAQLGAIKEIISKTDQEFKLNHEYIVIGTGGFARIFQTEKLFDHLIPELVLLGIKELLLVNS